MMKIKAVILDDELLVAKGIEQLVSRHCPEIELLGLFTSIDDAVQFIREHPIDLVFLDVELGNASGFDFLNQINKSTIQLIFITAHQEYAIDALRVNAVDYLLKPINYSELILAVQRAKSAIQSSKELNTHANYKLLVPIRGGYEMLEPKKITYLEASGSYTHVFTSDKQKFTLSRNLKDVSRELPPNYFFRCHNSYHINIEYVRRFYSRDGYRLELEGGVHIPISRRRIEEFKIRWK